MNPLRRLIIPGLILIVVITAGVLGYIYIEKWTLVDSIYMVVITLSTVGFREVKELSEAGRLLTISIIIMGVGTVAYTVGQLIELMVEGQIVGFRRRVRMEKDIASLKDHYIICGFGRVGHQIAEEFKSEKVPFVVIDSKPKTAEELSERGIPHIIGDVTSDENLENAGIRRAKGLIACADSDTANVFVTLSSKAINPGLNIISRASNVDTEKKLRKAGADSVISPYLIAGRRMAATALQPIASDFLDVIMHKEHLELQIREKKIRHGSKLIGLSLQQADIKKKSGSTILAIRKPDGRFDLQPLATTVIEEEDILVVLGTPGQLESMGRLG
ncbi:MAG: NAD-binding protein [Candidatus Saganbacteria bacterium]|nr:NAD-binding protein [Candidatus Saganbacteria bacterium]